MFGFHRFLFTILISTFYLLPTYSKAQSSIGSVEPDPRLVDAREAYHRNAYRTVVEYIDQIESSSITQAQRIELDYLKVLSMVRLDPEQGQPLLSEFLKRFPTSSYNNQVNFELSKMVFDKKQYVDAIDYLIAVDETRLDEKGKYNFMLGFSYWKVNATGEEYFRKVLNLNSGYEREATYALAYLLSQKKDYIESQKLLLTIDSDERDQLSDDIIELLASNYFYTEDNEKLLELGNARLTESASSVNKTLHRLMGEVYFGENKYRQASKSLQRSLDLSKGKMDGEGYYKLGFSFYKSNDEAKAIQYFKLAGLETNELGQLSNYYLGLLYQKAGNGTYAISAFKNASKSGSNLEIKEESAFLTGKLQIDQGNYQEGIKELTQFKSSASSKVHLQETNELITKAYLSTSNYDLAIAHIEQTGILSSVQKNAYQNVCLLKAQQLYNDSKFDLALGFLSKSLKYPVDPELASSAYYLQGECQSIGKMNTAEKSYLEAIRYSKYPSSINSGYGLGYYYYNIGRYEDSEKWLTYYVINSTPTATFYWDAKLRIADLLYVQKKYPKALDAYTSLLANNKVAQDYVAFQLGLCHLLLEDAPKAKAFFEKVLSFPNSIYNDNALLQMGQMAIKKAAWSEAILSFNKIITEFPQSSLVPFAYSSRALSHVNLSDQTSAMKDYIYILDHFIHHSVANNALLGLQELQQRGAKVENFDQYMAAYIAANPQDSSTELIVFESGKAKYFNGEYAAAIDLLQTFIAKNPESSLKTDAYYYIGDSYLRLEKWSEASLNLGEAGLSTNSFQMRALDKRGKALLQLKDYSKAIANYSLLMKTALNKKDLYNGREGLMVAYFSMNKLDSSLFFANAILSEEWRPINASEQTWLVKGKIFILKGDDSSATDELLKVINGPKDAVGAEAKYLLGKILFNQGSYQRSLETLFDLNRDYGSYPGWLGKSFLLIAENYLKLNEILQAKATLNSIIENSPIPEIKSAASQQLKAIQGMEQNLIIKKDSLR